MIESLSGALSESQRARLAELRAQGRVVRVVRSRTGTPRVVDVTSIGRRARPAALAALHAIAAAVERLRARRPDVSVHEVARALRAIATEIEGDP